MVKPVSYTHLDVYKRQLLSTPETATDIDAQLLEVTSSNDILVVVIANEPQSLTSQLDGIANPVSYTHLDVYKRQPEGCVEKQSAV